ncbi:pyridoxamine 5'-phosphate oxidase family protein [Sneathiella aquimaris]|uniref:pyridoxamine 5'-phosphate oxidase family protein n=1 Tax=Sneathiella aquimaris TaxID=2599305 RepID=UPI00146C6819|nr:pyridoxamine 5'-phosphate oxidase family protein [Sneathiella aquimaris]
MSINSLEELRAIYGEPKEAVLKKILPSLEDHGKNFIARSPFLIMSTSDKNGRADASPKGDMAGFVLVPDNQTILIPDRIGNNITDSLRNIIENPEVGLIFFIPGIRETLRVNGPCEILADADLLDRFKEKGKTPRTVLKVTVREAYMHCGKAIIRSDLWGETHKVSQKDFPSLGKILADQIAGLDSLELDESLEKSYSERLY